MDIRPTAWKEVEDHIIHLCKHRNRKMMGFQNIFPIVITIIICPLRSHLWEISKNNFTHFLSCQFLGLSKCSYQKAPETRRLRWGYIGIGRTGLDDQGTNQTQVFPEPLMGEGNTAVETPAWRTGRTSTLTTLYITRHIYWLYYMRYNKMDVWVGKNTKRII